MGIKIQKNTDVKKIFDPILFWDAEVIDIRKNAPYVIARILDYGGDDDIKMLRRLYPADKIIETVKKRRGLSVKTAKFWAVYFRIPQKDVACLKKSSRKTQLRQ